MCYKLKQNKVTEKLANPIRMIKVQIGICDHRKLLCWFAVYSYSYDNTFVSNHPNKNAFDAIWHFHHFFSADIRVFPNIPSDICIMYVYLYILYTTLHTFSKLRSTQIDDNRTTIQYMFFHWFYYSMGPSFENFAFFLVELMKWKNLRPWIDIYLIGKISIEWFCIFFYLFFFQNVFIPSWVNVNEFNEIFLNYLIDCLERTYWSYPYFKFIYKFYFPIFWNFIGKIM